MNNRWHLPAAKIIEYIKRHYVYKVRREGEEYVICNPLNGDIGFHFNINPKKGFCHDWRGDDGWSGAPNPKTGKRNVSFLNFVRIARKCSIQEAFKLVVGTEVLDKSAIIEATPVIENDMKLPSGSVPIEDNGNTLTTTIIMWLMRRGYTQKDIEAQALQHCGNDVVWPYFEFGEMVYWQSRSFVNKTFRFPDRNIYKDGKVCGISDVSKGDFLYGFDEVQHHGCCYITESIFDKNSIGLGALASGGAILTDNQCKKLKMSAPKQIVLAPDNDKAGLQSIVANYNRLRSYFDDLLYVLPPTKCDGKDIKDWNEIITVGNQEKSEILSYINKNMKPLNDSSILRLKLRTK
jgi:hypothetical protein